MAKVDVLPDVLLIVRSWLLSRAGLTSLVANRISTRSGPTPQPPYLTIQRIGGVPTVRRRLDQARLQIDAWGPTDSEQLTHQVARVARAELHRMEGYVHPEGVVTAVDDLLGIAWAPWQPGDQDRGTTPVPRYTFDVAVFAHVQ